jgi:RNA polymerase sigma-70 factor (ECF subfamily)
MLKSIDSDEVLVAAALAGSEQAWESLVLRYETRIYNKALRLSGNPADALDLVQEVFLAVFRNLPRFRGESKFSSWVFRIVHNKSVDRVRRWQPRIQQARSESEESEEVEANWPAASEHEPDTQFAQQQLNYGLQALLAELPLEQRLVIELKIFQSLTFEEIAMLQQVSDNTVKTRFYAALKRLQTLQQQANRSESDYDLS